MFRYQDQVQHFKILRDGMGKYFLWAVKFDSINELVEYHRRASVNHGQNLVLKDMIGSTQSEQVSLNEIELNLININVMFFVV